MQCMKCGRDVSGRQVFCDSCLETMEKYPVRPGTVIALPKRKTQEYSKKSGRKKRELTEKEQIAYLRRRLRRSHLIALALFLILGILSILLFHAVQDADGPIIGRNYTVDATSN